MAVPRDQLEAVGVREAVLCTGYQVEQVAAALRDRHGPRTLAYSREDRPPGTGGALRLALSGRHPLPGHRDA